MAFVNEYTPKEDIEKYRFKEIDKRIGIGQRTNATDWTVDRERSMYLRHVAWQNGEDHQFTPFSGWTFLWKGHLLWMDMENIESRGKRGEPGFSRKRITQLYLMGDQFRQVGWSTERLPSDLATQRDAILKDIYDALLAYKDGGVFASSTTYELTLETGEGV
ncbi:hypothetical protein AGMMS49545_23350 [Betaproteobacteria bacterium]|nr:hypothetical protein AGMMS49545_23350 [Betaproteobacteria bacterium]GHU48535.1 hypothetical protein AGMMS50289_25240 [Betaproteobacteria bacterium]